jgi:phosphoribosylglycinamide formyltransferase-1
VKRIVILISGRGSNMEAIIQAAQGDYCVAKVISNRPEAAGLAFARERGIPVQALDHKQFASRELFDEALAAEIDSCAPDLVVLAGYMRVLSDAFVRHYAGRMLNIHPSLLPAFAGLHTHQRAIESGAQVHGATVHFVTPELDSGPIVIQAVVPVLPDDDEASLAARVLQQEHRIYPQAIRWYLADRLQICGNRVRLLAARTDAQTLTVPVLEP